MAELSFVRSLMGVHLQWVPERVHGFHVTGATGHGHMQVA